MSPCRCRRCFFTSWPQVLSLYRCRRCRLYLFLCRRHFVPLQHAFLMPRCRRRFLCLRCSGWRSSRIGKTKSVVSVKEKQVSSAPSSLPSSYIIFTIIILIIITTIIIIIRSSVRLEKSFVAFAKVFRLYPLVANLYNGVHWSRFARVSHWSEFLHIVRRSNGG